MTCLFFFEILFKNFIEKETSASHLCEFSLKECRTSACDYSQPRSAFCDVTFTRQTYARGRDSKEYTNRFTVSEWWGLR